MSWAGDVRRQDPFEGEWEQIPFRRRARWAWWACWVPVLANLTYTLTIGHYGTTTLVYSLIADVALPALLLLHIPAFFGTSRRTS